MSMSKTRTIKVAFYKKAKTFFGRLIRFQQRRIQGMDWRHSQYSHSEVVFCGLSDEEIQSMGEIQNDKKIINEEVHDGFENAVFFSSAESEGGVRFKRVKPKKQNWDFVNISVSEEEFVKILQESTHLSGRNYGWGGIFYSQFLNYNLKNSWIARLYNKLFKRYFGYFCSEVTAKVLHTGIGNEFSRAMYKNYEVFINPGKLHERISRVY